MMCRKIINQSGFTLIEITATVVIVAVFSAIMLTMISESQYGSLFRSSGPLRWMLKSSDLSTVMVNIMADYNLSKSPNLDNPNCNPNWKPYYRWKRSTNYIDGTSGTIVDKVLPVGTNGRFYICKTGGTSGASEPKWRDYGDTQDGSVTWKAGVWVKQTPYLIGDIVIPSNPNGHFYRCKTAGTTGVTEPVWPLTGSNTINDGAPWVRLLGYLQLQIGTADANLKDNSYGKYYVVENRFVKFVSNTIQSISTGEAENILEVKIKNDEGKTLKALFTAKEN